MAWGGGIMRIGDLVKSTGFGPEGVVGEIGLIINHDPKFPRTWLVRWTNGLVTSYAEDGLMVISNAA